MPGEKDSIHFYTCQRCIQQILELLTVKEEKGYASDR